MTQVLNKFDITVMPKLFGKLSNRGLMDTMTISRITRISDGAGGYEENSATNYATNVPVDIKIDRKGNRYDMQGKLIALPTYLLEFPATQNELKLEIDISTDRLIVNARGQEPQKTFRILSPAYEFGTNQYVCVLES